jgi:hypothetical protein
MTLTNPGSNGFCGSGRAVEAITFSGWSVEAIEPAEYPAFS